MKVTVYFFVKMGKSESVETFVDEERLVDRMIAEMGKASLPVGTTDLNAVLQIFKKWSLSQLGPDCERYAVEATDLEIPVRVVVGLEGGCFLGAEASHDGISIEPFDWDDACDSLGKAGAAKEYGRLTHELVSVQ